MPLTLTPTPVIYPMRLELVGGFGGHADALALSDYRIYLQVAPRVVTIDISSPYHPVEIGHSDVPIDDIELIDTSDDGHVLVKDIASTVWEFEALPDGNLTLLRSYPIGDLDRPEMDTTTELTASAGGYRFTYDPNWLSYPGAWLLNISRQGEEIITAILEIPCIRSCSQSCNCLLVGLSPT